MVARVGKPAPHFVVDAVMPDGSFKKVDLKSFKGSKYVVLVFYPLDFTFVCPSEVVAFDNSVEEFEKKDVQILFCSVDSTYCHLAWQKVPREKGGIGNVKFPMLSDIHRKMAIDYGVLNEEDNIACRGLFLIDKAGDLQHMLVNTNPIGRSVDEVNRVLDAIQFHEAHGEVCPANWKKGKPGMKATTEGVAAHMKSQA